MTPRSLVLLCASPLLAQSLDPAANAATAPSATSLRVPVHTHPVAAGEAAYGHWAAGDSYKASFAGGMTFYPQLGQAYPHNQPFGWHTTSVRLGNKELLLPGRTPRMTTHDWRVEYAHGAVVEAYDVLGNGLEQTFTFAERPAGDGDLCITGTCATDLTATAVENAATDLVFRDAAGAPILTYGQAVAIDADGDRFAVRTSHQGSTITLRLAASDLQRADFPLVVDPLLTATFGGSLGTATAAGDAEFACETVNPSVTSVAAFTRYYSASDADVIAMTSAITFYGPTLVFSDLLASTSASLPSVAHVAATNRWVLVYQSFTTAAATMQLRAVTFAGGVAAPAVSAQVPHTVAAGTHEWRPIVSGIAEGGTGNHALVVYQREDGTTPFANTTTSSVWGMFFDTATVPGTWSPPLTIFDDLAFDYERPTVNRATEGGTAFSRFVACQAFENAIAADDWDLVGKLVDQGGTVSASAWTSTFLGSLHKLGPVVDGRNGRFCVAFDTVTASVGKILDTAGTEVRTRRLDWPHGAAAPTAEASFTVETLDADAGRVLEVGAIAHNGGTRSHWALTWRNNLSVSLFASRVGYQGKALQAKDLIATATGSSGLPIPGAAGIAHHDDFGGTTVCFPLLSAGSASAWARQFDSPSPLYAHIDAVGCGGGTLSWSGLASFSSDRQRIGCEFSGPRVQQAMPNALHLMLVATATADVPLVDPIILSGCSLLVPFSGPDHLGYLPLAVGNAVQWELPLPETLPALTLYFQDWALDPASNVFAATGRLKVELVK